MIPVEVLVTPISMGGGNLVDQCTPRSTTSSEQELAIITRTPLSTQVRPMATPVLLMVGVGWGRGVVADAQRCQPVRSDRIIFRVIQDNTHTQINRTG